MRNVDQSASRANQPFTSLFGKRAVDRERARNGHRRAVVAPRNLSRSCNAVGKLHPALDDDLQSWLAAQRVFFVATAPSGDGGHVNCSPKGGDSLQVLGPTT